MYGLLKIFYGISTGEPPGLGKASIDDASTKAEGEHLRHTAKLYGRLSFPPPHPDPLSIRHLIYTLDSSIRYSTTSSPARQ